MGYFMSNKLRILKKRYGATLIGVVPYFKKLGNIREYFVDAAHPSAKGHTAPVPSYKITPATKHGGGKSRRR